MHARGRTTIFPREDNFFKLKEAFPYDEILTKVWKERPRTPMWDEFVEWIAHLTVGFLFGCCACGGALGVEWIYILVVDTNQALIHGKTGHEMNVFVPWLWYCGMSAIMGLISGSMTTFWA